MSLSLCHKSAPFRASFGALLKREHKRERDCCLGGERQETAGGRREGREEGREEGGELTWMEAGMGKKREVYHRAREE